MKMRNASFCDRGLDINDWAMVVEEDFWVDGFNGSYAVSDAEADEDGKMKRAFVGIGWEEGEGAREVQLDVADQTTGNLILSSLGTDLSLQALIALGFKRVL